MHTYQTCIHTCAQNLPHFELLNSGFLADERIEHAPCIRLVAPSDVKLFVITIAGAKLGTADNCDIVLPKEEAETPRVWYQS